MLSRTGTEAALAGVFPLRPRRRVRGRPFGSMPSARRGGCFDPVSSRLYRPGDDLRRIDRHASARLSAAHDSDELVVREHYAEEAAKVVLLVDPAPTMALFPEPLPWLHKPAAVQAAAAVIGAARAISARLDQRRSSLGGGRLVQPRKRLREEGHRRRGVDEGGALGGCLGAVLADDELVRVVRGREARRRVTIDAAQVVAGPVEARADRVEAAAAPRRGHAAERSAAYAPARAQREDAG